MAGGMLSMSSRLNSTTVTLLSASLGSRPKAMALRRKVSPCCLSRTPALTCTRLYVSSAHLCGLNRCDGVAQDGVALLFVLHPCPDLQKPLLDCSWAWLWPSLA